MCDCDGCDGCDGRDGRDGRDGPDDHDDHDDGDLRDLKKSIFQRLQGKMLESKNQTAPPAFERIGAPRIVDSM